MSLIFISNLNHVLKKIKFIFNFKNIPRGRTLLFRECYHFYDGAHHAQVKLHVIWKKFLFYRDLHQHRT